jgi:hypothetical protein
MFNRAPHPRISSQTDRARRRNGSAPAPLHSQDERIPTGGGRINKSRDAARAADGRIYVLNSSGQWRSMQQKSRKAPQPQRYASPRCVKPAYTTSTALWLDRCQCWSRDRRRRQLCGCVSAGVNRGANVRRTRATGDEVERTTEVIARIVAY